MKKRTKGNVIEITDKAIMIGDIDKEMTDKGYVKVSSEVWDGKDGDVYCKNMYTLYTIANKKYASDYKTPVIELDEKAGIEKYLLIGDLQYPYTNVEFLLSLCKAAKKNGVNNVIFMGDILDLAWLSSFKKSLNDININSINKSAYELRTIMLEIAKMFKGVKIVLDSNHDERLARDIFGNNIGGRGIKTGDGYEYYNVLTYLGINKVYDFMFDVVIGDAYIYHGEGGGSYIPQNTIKRNMIMAHLHRPMITYNNKVEVDGKVSTIYKAVVGCMIDLNGVGRTIPAANSHAYQTWGEGSGILYVDSNTGKTNYQHVINMGNVFMIDGKYYGIGEKA